MLALVQGALISAVAVNHTRAAVIAWCGLAVETALILTVTDSSLTTLLTIAVGCATAVAGITVAVAIRLHAQRA